jgi:hypothetical protein
VNIPNDWAATPSGRARARGLGLPLPGNPGSANAITDIAGLEVGYCTLVDGEGPLVRGQGPVRTGVTAILPRGRSGAAMMSLPRQHFATSRPRSWIESGRIHYQFASGPTLAFRL